jgi:hypothetical protein
MKVVMKTLQQETFEVEVDAGQTVSHLFKKGKKNRTFRSVQVVNNLIPLLDFSDC